MHCRLGCIKKKIKFLWAEECDLQIYLLNHLKFLWQHKTFLCSEKQAKNRKGKAGIETCEPETLEPVALVTRCEGIMRQD